VSNNSFPLLVIAVFALGSEVGTAAPKPAETPTEKRDKAVKEFVAKAMIALGRHDFDTFVGYCDVPYYIQPSTRVASGIRRTNEGFAKDLASRFDALDGKGKFDGSKHLVRSIQTLKEAKKRFTDQQALDAEAVMAEEDLVVHVVLDDPDSKFHSRLLVKLVDGKPRLVGIQPEQVDK